MKEWMKDFQLQEINVLIIYTLIAKWRKGVGGEKPPSTTWKLYDTKNEFGTLSTVCDDSLCTLSSRL